MYRHQMGLERTLDEKRENSLGASLLLAGLGYFLLTFATLYFKSDEGVAAPVWAPNALLLSFILLNPHQRMAGFVVIGMVANIIASLLCGTPPPVTPFYAAANGLEISIAAWGLRRWGGGSRLFFEPKAMPRILLWAGLIAPLVSALPAALVAWIHGSHPFLGAYTRWFMADGLGLLIFTPIFIALMNGDFRHRLVAMGARRRFELCALTGLVAATTAIAFFAGSDLLLSIVIAPMMLVALRGGWLATTTTVAVVAVIAGGAISLGYGPPGLQGSGSLLHIYGIQTFIAALMIVQVPVSAALTERQSMIERLRESEQSLHLLAAGSPLLLLAFDLDGRCMRAMGTKEPLLDHPSTSLVGRHLSEMCEEGQYELQRACNAALDEVSASHTAEFRTLRLRDSWLEVVFRANFDERGRCIGTIATVHDITMRKNQELSLSRTATTDSLTGVLNRAGFRDRLEHALLTAEPGTLSLAMIDIDRFKLINDNSGHQVGDAVLKEIARRISLQVRGSDAVGRIGGDEFVVLLPTSNWERVQQICNRIVAGVGCEPIALASGHSLRAAISCGVTRYQQGQSADEFIHEADTALYRAKRSGRNQVVAA